MAAKPFFLPLSLMDADIWSGSHCSHKHCCAVVCVSVCECMCVRVCLSDSGSNDCSTEGVYVNTGAWLRDLGETGAEGLG